jgi:hypothetical protein
MSLAYRDHLSKHRPPGGPCKGRPTRGVKRPGDPRPLRSGRRAVLVRVALSCGLGLVLLSGALALSRARTPAQPADRTSASHVAVVAGCVSQPAEAPVSSGTLSTETPDAVRALDLRTWPRVQQPADLVVKRRGRRTEDDLIIQIRQASELTLDTTAERTASAGVLRAAAQTDRKEGDALLAFVAGRADLAGLPLRRGEACRLPSGDAARLDECAAVLRTKTGNVRFLKDVFEGDAWRESGAVPALMQMLPPEAAAVREILVGQLARIEGRQASEALAQLALFDLNPEVRERAVRALAERPSGEYRAALLRGFTHPWPPVADHAAEALVALKATDVVPALAELLDAPDPRVPYQKAGGKERFLKEMVRIHHRKNCLLCHAPSFSANDRPRASVPLVNEPGYYGSGSGVFVRADVTYLKQDFSVSLPAGERPVRWDFAVRERVASENDALLSRSRTLAVPCEQRAAVLFALRELTARYPGPNAADWRQFVRAEGNAAWAAPGRR